MLRLLCKLTCKRKADSENEKSFNCDDTGYRPSVVRCVHTKACDCGKTAETFSSATLKVGSSGKDVYELQGRLKYLGYLQRQSRRAVRHATKKCRHLVSMEIRVEIRWRRRSKDEAKAVGSDQELEA